ncbi:MAG: RsmE family RNA methyltransferase [Deltaproteobacteria bacterium]|nr:RsmE family RNA methyltransferase [Deltaproteobacteria bacterium]
MLNAALNAKVRRAFIDDDRLSDSGNGLQLPERVAFRFARVLRLQIGDPIELFDAKGRVARGKFQPPDRMIDVVVAAVDDGLPPLLVVQALTKTDKLELVAAKATELGASRLLLWSASRSVVKLDDERGDKKVARLQRVAADAARQCGRARPLQVEGPVSTKALLPLLKQFVDDGGLAVTGIVDADDTLSGLLARSQAKLVQGFAIVIGPEGGVAPDEEDAFVDVGAQGVRFSRFVLRTETAALAALAIVQTALGEA